MCALALLYEFTSTMYILNRYTCTQFEITLYVFFFFFLVISTLPMHFSGHGKILEILWVHIAHVNKNTEAPDRESNIYKSQIINKRLKCLLFLGWIPSNSLPTSPPFLSLSLSAPLRHCRSWLKISKEWSAFWDECHRSDKTIVYFVYPL